MSDLKVEIIKVGVLSPHPSADTLDITKVFDYPVIVKRGNFAEGDLAAYVPIDAVVPASKAWEWLHAGAEDQKHRRVKAKRLRGIYSEGLLIPVSTEYFGNPAEFHEGDEVSGVLGITKYDPGPLRGSGGAKGHGPNFHNRMPITVSLMPKYTDMENIRRYPGALIPGEQVLIMEKIHGSNARYGYLPAARPPIKWWEKAINWAFGWKPAEEEMFVVGSHNTLRWTDYSSPKDWHARADSNIWHKAAKNAGLEQICKDCPGLVFFGEVFGDVQDLTYGAPKGSGLVEFRLFDIYDTAEKRYLDIGETREVAENVGLLPAPVLYKGPWNPEELPIYRDGITQEVVNCRDAGRCSPAHQIREGCVIRPVQERTYVGGRLILKAVSPAYLTRKDGSEAKE